MAQGEARAHAASVENFVEAFGADVASTRGYSGAVKAQLA